jgi:hypothetical protein
MVENLNEYRKTLKEILKRKFKNEWNHPKLK